MHIYASAQYGGYVVSTTTVFINILALVALFIAFIKDRKKTKQSLIIALKSFIKILPALLLVIVFIGLFMGFVPRDQISRIIGNQAGFWGIFIIALFGAISHIPSLISFPLGASLIESGASLTAVAAFITTLTMIGIITLPVEIKELGKKMALLRNGLSFLIAITIAFIMGAIL